MDTNFIWKNCLSEVMQHVSPQHFTTWFQPIRVAGGDEKTLELEVPNRFFLEWIKEHYVSLIEETLKKTGDNGVTLKWRVAEDRPKKATPKKGAQKSTSQTRLQRSSHGLTTKYTFDNFVVGSANEFAHAACYAVSKQLGTKYNPLFIYGGVGLGKTHLLQAIGNRVFDKSPSTNVCYYTSERFMNEFISFVSRNKMTEFRRKFRNVDLLLIDDIQFWAKKERTQEEFFHTFNVLYENHKQIIVTSDKYPKDISGIEERLRSRFECGLVADIQPPDTEMKIAILRTKAKTEEIKMPDDVITWLATVGGSNIRELEGYLTRIIAVSSLTGQDITLSMSKEALNRLLKGKEEKALSIEEIQKTVATFYNIKQAELKSKRRHKAIALPRQIAMYIARENGNFSYPEIGSTFGGKDHSTAIHAFKKIKTAIEKDGEIKRVVLSITNRLGVV